MNAKKSFPPARVTTLNLFSGLILTLSVLVVSFWVSWHGLASINFAYSQGYKLLDIEKHIQRYGPQNRYKKGFALTAPEQHEALFAEIVEAIQNGGEGLDKIEYKLPFGKSNLLLREPEVVHLQDVANLISLFNGTSIVCVVLLAALVAFYYKLKQPAPSLKQVALGLLGLCIPVGITLLVFGPKKVFYWLHVKIFPEDHQWFFYYQESLMTTLMKAPDVFGFIGAIWAVIAILLFALLQWVIAKMLQQKELKQPIAKGKKK